MELGEIIKNDKNQNPRWPPDAILDFGLEAITVERLEQDTSNLAQGYLLTMHYEHLSPNVWPQNVLIYRCFLNWLPWFITFKVNTGQIWRQIWTRSIWLPIYSPYTYLWPFGHNAPFITVRDVWKRMTLKYGFQGQHRSNVKKVWQPRSSQIYCCNCAVRRTAAGAI